MSKKRRHKHNQSSQLTVVGHAEEYTIIRHDLFRVVILNLFYLAGVLLLYYTNLKAHYLEAWFTKVFHF